ncbi:MAG: rRNA (cytosine967-C5)-methyltransferase [Methylobacteriaceae bacterium]|jgi:16S rRNA (cytosine967-C5)-methyltransferase|nr:rRNA (cytosine967-C5)-methyltransferase [Methylobacteriaceae bacterium]
MTPGARVAAAIEVLDDIFGRRRPAQDALKDWGLAHRFAGSKDRAAIAGIVFDALRRKASAAWIMQDEAPRAIVLGASHLQRGLSADEIAELCSGEGHSPAPLSEAERAHLSAATVERAPLHVAADIPEWLAPHFSAAFGERAVEEGRALAERAPVDLRVNRLKTSRGKALAALSHLDPQPTAFSPVGLRISLRADGRAPALSAEPAFAKGLVELQDEGSQLASLLCAVKAGEQVLDLCAGGGGKTLALAAEMENRGQIYATDTDGRRLMPIYARLERANVRNVQVRAPRGAADILSDLRERCDLVLIDAPCTGTGTWRRNPDAKWRIRPGALAERIKAQDELLARAAEYAKPGGRIAYVTCSVLREENEDRVSAFLDANPQFASQAADAMVARAGLASLQPFASDGAGLRLSPATTRTDGFYIAMLMRA